jgi:hypothetical protein
MPIWTEPRLNAYDLMTLDQIWNEPWPVYKQGSLTELIEEGRRHNERAIGGRSKNEAPEVRSTK